MEEGSLMENCKPVVYVNEISKGPEVSADNESERNLSYVEGNKGQILLANEVPQGRHLGFFSTMNLFISRIVGGGIYAVPSSIFVNCGGNIGLFFSMWILATVMAFIGLFIFLELGFSYPKSGGRKPFLEVIYDKPKMMTSVILCAYSVLTCFAMSAAIIFGKYTLYALGFDEKYVNEESRLSNYVGIGIVALIIFIHGFSLNHGILVQNILGGFKLIIILIMCISGIYAFCFYESSGNKNFCLDSLFKFQDATLVSSSSITAAFIQCFYCFAGWDTVHSVTSEIKNPNYILKVAGPLSLLISLLCYICLNIAYLKVLSFEEIKSAGPLVGSILFSKLYGERVGRQLVTISIALSSASNIFVTIYGISRMNQEVFREGHLPFSSILARNWPYSAPFPSLLVCGLVTSFWLLLLPSSGAAFDYLINFEGYGSQLTLLFVAIGLFLHGRRHPTEFSTVRASSIGAFFFILVSFYLAVGPFFGDQRKNTISFLPPYQIAVLFVFLICFLFWLLKFVILPKLFGYKLKSEIIIQEDGLSIKKWYKSRLL